MIDARARYLCGPGGVGGFMGATFGGVSPGEGGAALAVIGLLAVAGWWAFRRFGHGSRFDAEAQAEAVVERAAAEAAESDVEEDEREPTGA